MLMNVYKIAVATAVIEFSFMLFNRPMGHNILNKQMTRLLPQEATAPQLNTLEDNKPFKPTRVTALK